MILTFDSQNLLVDPYQIRKIPHDSFPVRRMETQPISRSRGVLVLDDQFSEKKFTITGNIVGTSQDNLEANIDAAKELFSRVLKNLDIGYSSGVRRYQAYVDNCDFSGRDFYHMLFCPFSAEFYIPSGIGIDPNLQTSSNAGITTTPYNNSFSMIGSARANPIITITVTAASSLSVLSFSANGDTITITHALVANDVLVIDTNAKKVTLNGTEIDYAGLFPRMIIGTNAYTIANTRTSATYNVSISYNPAYL